MPTSPSNDPASEPAGNGQSESGNSTGLPLVSTWPRLYTFVLLFFAACVLALLWLTRAFS